MSAIRRFESRERHMTVRPGCVSPVLEGAPGATCIDFCMFGNISGNSHLHELLSSQEESGFCMLVNKQKGTRFHVTEIICFCMVNRDDKGWLVVCHVSYIFTKIDCFFDANERWCATECLNSVSRMPWFSVDYEFVRTNNL
uniref:CNNM transmembrane domain-containing protein n=1 Tax=Panagrellus redivivus TaxID=6233 RepID=A0A7E4UQE9_PANRE